MLSQQKHWELAQVLFLFCFPFEPWNRLNFFFCSFGQWFSCIPRWDVQQEIAKCPGSFVWPWQLAQKGGSWGGSHLSCSFLERSWRDWQPKVFLTKAQLTKEQRRERNAMKTSDIEELLVNISLLDNQMFVGIIFICVMSNYGEWILSRGKFSDNGKHRFCPTNLAL